MGASEIILQGKDLSYRYESSPESDLALDGLNITVKRGELLAVLGHNGSESQRSPSTLTLYCCLLEGQCMWLAWTHRTRTCSIVRQTVGMVFQNPDNQIVANVVEEDVAFAPENLGVETHEIRKRVDDALKAVGMYEYREHAPHRLSGGQKQRVAIAGVIAMMPECIVLDEPTAMLDPVGRNEVLKTIKKLNSERGITIVLITHHMEEAAICDRVVVMESGRIAADGTPKEVFAKVELMKSIDLAVPQTIELIYRLRKRGLDIPLDALSVEGVPRQL